MNRYLYIIAAVLLLLAGGWAGYHLREPEVREVTRVEIVERVRDVVQWRTRTVIRTVEKRPDGTVVERDETREEDGSHEKDSEQSRSVSYSQQRPDWSLGVHYRSSSNLRVAGKLQWSNVEVAVSRRILGAIWTELGLQPSTREYRLGLRLEW